jgi:hypothetical protein
MAWTPDRVAKLYERVALTTEVVRRVTEHDMALGTSGISSPYGAVEDDARTDAGHVTFRPCFPLPLRCAVRTPDT